MKVSIEYFGITVWHQDMQWVCVFWYRLQPSSRTSWQPLHLPSWQYWTVSSNQWCQTMGLILYKTCRSGNILPHKCGNCLASIFQVHLEFFGIYQGVLPWNTPGYNTIMYLFKILPISTKWFSILFVFCFFLSQNGDFLSFLGGGEWGGWRGRGEWGGGWCSVACAHNTQYIRSRKLICGLSSIPMECFSTADCSLHLYGSSCSGFGLKDSDVNMDLQITDEVSWSLSIHMDSILRELNFEYSTGECCHYK